MTDPSNPYKELLGLYLNTTLSAEEFRDRYEAAFLGDDTMFEDELYTILNELFIDTDALTSNPNLVAERPSYYQTEEQFRKRAELAAIHLDQWRKKRIASG